MISRAGLKHMKMVLSVKEVAHDLEFCFKAMQLLSSYRSYHSNISAG
jgi:hypothetical protein